MELNWNHMCAGTVNVSITRRSNMRVQPQGHMKEDKAGQSEHFFL